MFVLKPEVSNAITWRYHLQQWSKVCFLPSKRLTCITIDMDNNSGKYPTLNCITIQKHQQKDTHPCCSKTGFVCSTFRTTNLCYNCHGVSDLTEIETKIHQNTREIQAVDKSKFCLQGGVTTKIIIIIIIMVNDSPCEGVLNKLGSWPWSCPYWSPGIIDFLSLFVQVDKSYDWQLAFSCLCWSSW